MATLENPAYYENADFTAPGRADNFLKWISPDYYEEETGEVDSPFGHVALVKIDPDLIATYVTEQGDPWMSERRNFGPGWYIIRINSDGLVWGLGYGGWCEQPGHEAFCADTFEELKARQDFAETAKAYGEWDTDDNN